MRPNAQRESTRRGGGTALSATHDHQSDQRDDDQGDDPERPLLDSGETSQDLIGNGRICDGAQTQALRCRSPVDRGNGKLARASAPLAFSSVTSQEAKSFALDGATGPMPAVEIPRWPSNKKTPPAEGGNYAALRWSAFL